MKIETAQPPADLAAQLKNAAEILEKVVANRALLARLSVEERTRLLKAAGEVYCPEVDERRRLVKAKVRQRKVEKTQRDQSKLNQTGIRKLRREKVFTTPNVFPPKDFLQQEIPDDPDFREVVEPQNCYICKKDYARLHHFYDQLCPECAALNFSKRTETADLRGRVALLTGGRVKIGYQAGIKLLRAGAQLIVCTRFPRDSAMRYAQETDFKDWGHRLEIFGLDLRHTPSVEAFCRHLLATRNRLDFIINNACQTVRRPPDFYQHMMEREQGPLHDLPEAARKLLGAYEGLRGYQILPEAGDKTTPGLATPGLMPGLSPVAGLTHAAAFAAALSPPALLPEELAAQKCLFPEGKLDQDLQQVDLRERNSWRLLMAEVSSVELLEVQLVNAIAPFILNARLKPLMLAHAGAGQAHRQCLGGRGPILSQIQDDPASAYEHGQGGVEHDDAHLRGGLSRGRHSHERGGHRLGDGRRPGAHRRAQTGTAPLSSAAGHRGRRGADC